MFKKMYKNFNYYYLIFLVLILPIIPKGVNMIFKYIPLRLALLSIFILFFILDLIKRRQLPKIKKFYIPYILMLLVMCGGFFVAEDKVLFLYTLAKFSFILLIVVAIINQKFSDNQISKIFDFLLFSTFVSSIIGLIQFFLRVNLNYNGIAKYPGAIGRITSTFHNPIYFAMFLFVVSFVSIYKIKNEKNKNKKILFLFYLMTYIALIFLTYTRSIVIILTISLFVMTIISLFQKNKTNSVIVLLLPFIFLCITAIYLPGAKYIYSSTVVSVLPEKLSRKVLLFANNTLKLNMDLSIYTNEKGEQVIFLPGGKKKNAKSKNDKNKQKDSSLSSRDEFLKLSNDVYIENKLFGIGLGNYEKHVLTNKTKYQFRKFGYPHNVFSHVKAESGFLAGVIFIFIFSIFVIIILLYAIIQRKIEYIILSIIWISMYLIGFFESFVYDTQFISLLMIVTALFIKKLGNMKKEYKNLFICSAGGHLTQMQQLKEIITVKNAILITDKTDISKSLSEDYEVKFLKYGSRQYIYKYIFIFMFNTIKSFYYFIYYNPTNIISTGAHTTVSMCYIGWIFDRKVIYIESFAKTQTPTLSGKLIYPISSVFIVQWIEMLNHYPKAEYWGGIY